MNNLEEKILRTIKENKLIKDGDKLVLAVSGGPDSIAMLNALNNIKNSKEINFEFVVSHINHMIREEAEEDENFVKDFCEKIGVQFFSKSIDVKEIANNNKIGLEEAGRIARYKYFDEVAKLTDSKKIAIAHNKNDSVETTIMHILRGCGTYGLHGIVAKNGKYIRPLIDCQRQEIEDYCKESNIEARIDKTNFENVYTRNKIRNVVIPYIKEEFNPNIIETISRLSEAVRLEDEFYDAFTKRVFDILKREDTSKQIIYDIGSFNMQDKVIKSRLVLYTIKRLMGTSNGIEKIHIDDILKLCEKNIGNKFLMPNKHLKVLVKNKKIYFIKNDN
ncbi:MAG: tRNA lysidine(34) synthetase TilS [Clostridia bacterium]|nr:tRNA lysidine(34) synthetase TilS [Clostridia bacterium]